MSLSQSQPWGVMEILRVKRYVGPWKSLAKPRSKGESLNPPVAGLSQVWAGITFI